MHKILITGASGYVGAMLVREFLTRDDVEAILAIDKEAKSELYEVGPRLKYIKTNLADGAAWMDEARAFAPDIVIHTAWQIREMYGKQDLQWKWNIGGSDNVFDFAFE